jgi:hypothetical protein
MGHIDLAHAPETDPTLNLVAPYFMTWVVHLAALSTSILQ